MINGGRLAIAGFYFVGGVAYAIMGTALFLGYGEKIFARMSFHSVEDLRDWIIKSAAIAMTLLGVFFGLVGWGIYTWRRWARVVVILISVYNVGALAFWVSRGTDLPFSYLLLGTLSIGFLFWAFHPDVHRAFASRGLAR